MATYKLVGALSANGTKLYAPTSSDTGAIAGIVDNTNTTDATTTTAAALKTAGGLAVVKSAIIGTGVTLASTSGNVGIGIAHGSADSKFHVYGGDSGVTGSGSMITVENAGNVIIELMSPDINYSGLYFKTPSAGQQATLIADYTNNRVRFGTQRTGGSVIFHAGADATNLTLSGASGSELATFAGDVTFSGANPEIRGGDTDGILYISPSTTGALGGNILLYGDTHATQAGDIVFRSSATTALSYDLSSTIWNFEANNLVTIGTFGSGNITIGNGANVSLLFSPSSGATRIGTWHQSADNISLGASGVADYFTMALGTGAVTLASDLTLSEGKLSITDTAAESALDINPATNETAAITLTKGKMVLTDGFIQLTNTVGTFGVSITQNVDAVGLYIDSAATTAQAALFEAPTAGAVVTMINQHATTPLGLSMNFSAASPNNATQYFLSCADSTNTKVNIYSNGAFWSRGTSEVLAGTAIPTGGTTGSGYKFSSTSNFGVFFGSGAPTLAAAKGSLYLRSDGSGVADRAYINTDGSTTWTAIATAG